MRAAPPALERLSYTDIPGWPGDDLAEFWPTLCASARAIATGAPELRKAVPTPSKLLEALAATIAVSPDAGRKHLESFWTPHRIRADGFVTAYYEPFVSGDLVRSKEFAAPILARPRDLDTHAGLYPDRRTIVAGAIATRTKPVVWLRDAVEVFLIQVQGSARVRLPDGKMVRLVYDGRNGRPYTSIGRELVARGAIAPEAMSLDALKDWLRANGAGAGGAADEVMNLNESYVFFRSEALADPQRGPIGGQSVPLTPLRSIAIDRTIWPYGLPFWVNANLPAGPFSRLMVAQDTGSAIVGPARADLFFGTGEAAGRAAGDVRHSADMFVLLPNGLTSPILAA